MEQDTQPVTPDLTPTIKKQRGRPPKTTMDKANPDKVKGGSGARANAFLEKLLPKGKCLFSEYVGKNGSKYGVFCAPATMHTNETESGVDLALWCCEIQKGRNGVIKRKPTIVNDPRRGKPRCFYQHFIIESDIVYEFAHALLELIDRDDVVEKRKELQSVSPENQDDEIEKKMRMLGMLR
jgi:hypothetical protein